MIRRDIKSKNGNVFEAHTFDGDSGLEIVTPKASGWRSAHRRHAKKRGFPTCALVITHEDHLAGTEQVRSRWIHQEG